MRWNCKFCRYCEYLSAIGNRSPCYDCKKGSNFELSKIYGVKTEPSYKPMTNGDRIRAMSDEELTEKFLWLISCRICPVRKECVTAKACKDTWKNWLKQPAEVEK